MSNYKITIDLEMDNGHKLEHTCYGQDPYELKKESFSELEAIIKSQSDMEGKGILSYLIEINGFYFDSDPETEIKINNGRIEFIDYSNNKEQQSSLTDRITDASKRAAVQNAPLKATPEPQH